MIDMVVIGGGFWGAAVYLKAKQQGRTCLVLDSAYSNAGSRNAGALTCKRWYKSDTIRNHIPKTWSYEKIIEWIDWLEEKELILHAGQWMYNKPRNTWRRNDDCYITLDINRILELAKPRHTVVFNILSKKDYCYIQSDDKPIKCKSVVVAAGRWSDRILQNSDLNTIGSAGLMGRAMLFKANPKALRRRCKDWNGEVASIIIRPYKNFDLLPNNKVSWYFGVTTEKKENEKAWAELAEAATYLFGGDAEVLHAIRGYRAVCTDGRAKVQVVDKYGHVVAATGGQKVGLGLAGVAADNVLELL